MATGSYSQDTDRTQTPFVETEVLVAVMAGDTERAEELVRDMLPGERRSLESYAVELGRVTFQVRREMREA